MLRRAGKLFFTSFLVFSSIPAISGAAYSIPQSDGRSRIEKWRNDLHFMVSELEIRHADLYANISRENFGRAVSQLSNKIPRLTDHQVQVELARLLAMIKDGHTGVFLPWDRQNGFRRYPVEIWTASDGLLIMASSKEHPELVGAKITRIGKTSIEHAVASITPLLPLDNEYAVRSLIPHYIVLPELLHALGIVENMEEAEFTIEDVRGRTLTVGIKPVVRDAKIDWQLVESKTSLPLWLSRRDEKYWFEYIEESKTLFLQFNSADVGVGEPESSFIAFCDSVVSFVEKNTIEKLVVDMRWNSGGNDHRTRHLLTSIIRCEKINKPGRLFTVISPNTYSAAVLHAVRLARYTETLFVGEPTGGRPNISGELRRFRLPNSNIEVRYSAVFHNASDPRDMRPAIMPDLKAELSSTDYRKGIDPALETIQNYKPKQPVSDLLLSVIEKRGIEEAVKEYKRLKRDRYNEFDFGNEELNRLGYHLLESNRLDAAVTILQLNAESYPYSAAVYNSLGEAYMRAGKDELAIENFKRAFAIDKRYSRALENLRRLQAKLSGAKQKSKHSQKSK